MRSEALLWATRGAGLAVGWAVVAGIAFIAINASGVLILVFIAILLASALEPFVGWVRARVPIGRGLTILAVYATFVIFVGVIVFLLLPAAIRQAEDLSKSLPGLLNELRTWAQGLRPPALSATLVSLIDAADNIFKPAPPPSPEQVVSASFTVVEALVSLVTLLAVIFFWLVEHARLQRWALSFVPAERRSGWRQAWNEIETRLGLWVRGQLTLMLAIGLATLVAYTILGVPSALLLAFFAALCEAIPIVGPALGAIPAVLVAATVSPQLALVVIGVCILLQFLEGNVLVPIVMKNTIGLSPFVVLVTLLLGAAVAGIVGAFLAVPIAASVEVILERLQARKVPVSQEPASDGAPQDDEATDDHGRTLPDSAASASAR
jgi:predicted PurR-regulated permease PerM